VEEDSDIVIEVEELEEENVETVRVAEVRHKQAVI